jgi:hypothetical protein
MGKSAVWATFGLADADLYQKKLTGLWWKEAEMELVQVTVCLKN